MSAQQNPNGFATIPLDLLGAIAGALNASGNAPNVLSKVRGLICEDAPPTQGAVEAVPDYLCARFGLGALIVTVGTQGDQHAVWLSEAVDPGPVGELCSSPFNESDVRVALHFPTMEQADAVYAALLNRTQGAGVDEAMVEAVRHRVGCHDGIDITPVQVRSVLKHFHIERTYLAGQPKGEG